MKKILTLVAFLFISVSALADCDHFYPKGIKIQPFGAVELCNAFFVTQYDASQNRAFFSSEILAPEGHTVVRKDAFRADKRLPNAVKPSAYAGTGFDRGHLVPADDATTPDEMFSTFVMTNMTPQNPKLNRVSWKRLEIQTRKLAKAAGQPITVVTGALYETHEQMNGVPIPSGYFKIIYIDGRDPLVYYVNNNDRDRPHKVQMSWIKAKTNMKFPEE